MSILSTSHYYYTTSTSNVSAITCDIVTQLHLSNIKYINLKIRYLFAVHVMYLLPIYKASLVQATVLDLSTEHLCNSPSLDMYRAAIECTKKENIHKTRDKAFSKNQSTF